MTDDKKARILIIEDEPGFRLIYRSVLEAHGYGVMEAQNGSQGLEMVKKEKPDLVLLDLILPEMNGYKVLQKIREDKEIKHTPVIVFSVLGSDKDIQKGKEAGADDYRIKGENSPETILEKISTLLENQSSHMADSTPVPD